MNKWECAKAPLLRKDSMITRRCNPHHRPGGGGGLFTDRWLQHSIIMDDTVIYMYKCIYTHTPLCMLVRSDLIRNILLVLQHVLS